MGGEEGMLDELRTTETECSVRMCLEGGGLDRSNHGLWNVEY